MRRPAIAGPRGQGPARNTTTTSDGGKQLNWDGLFRREVTALTQLRLNRAPYLEATRHRWGLADSPDCPCGEGPEDTAHFLLLCSRWELQRRTTIGADRSLIVKARNNRRNHFPLSRREKLT